MSNLQTKRYLDRAARAAIRASGHAEPNPLVGALIVKDGQVLGVGHHQRFGGLHAEREAIANARDNGHDPRGATLYCTLEPCNHHGKQPPCTHAVIESGIARVVIARNDPAEISGGGTQTLRAAGIEVERTDCSLLAHGVSDPFVHRIETGRPWVIAKWAQTLDGKIATSTGESQWITGELCRKRVHRLRSRVDAVLVGIGTVIADDPMLTARGVAGVRRVAKRVVIDTHARISPGSKLVRSAREYPTILITTRQPENELPGVQVLRVDNHDQVDLSAALDALGDIGISTVLVEAGARILGSMVDQDLIDEAFVHLAPGVLADADAIPVAIGRSAPRLTDLRRYQLVRSKPICDDVELHYRRRSPGRV